MGCPRVRRWRTLSMADKNKSVAVGRAHPEPCAPKRGVHVVPGFVNEVWRQQGPATVDLENPGMAARRNGWHWHPIWAQMPAGREMGVRPRQRGGGVPVVLAHLHLDIGAYPRRAAQWRSRQRRTAQKTTPSHGRASLACQGSTSTCPWLGGGRRSEGSAGLERVRCVGGGAEKWTGRSTACH